MNKRNYIMHCSVGKLRISPYFFYKYAKDYLGLTKKLKETSNFSPVPYFLYCRSIELSLKSLILLLNENMTVIDIKRYDHNLSRILKKAEVDNKKEILNKSDKEIIKVANYLYSNKGIERSW